MNPEDMNAISALVGFVVGALLVAIAAWVSK